MHVIGKVRMFIDNLLNILKREKITPAELCKRTGLHKSCISHWKSGSKPTMDKVVKIANELDVSLDYLVLGERNSKLEMLYDKASEDDKKIIDILLNKYM